MKSLWLPVYNANNEIFFSKYKNYTKRKEEEDEGRKYCYMWNVRVW